MKRGSVSTNLDTADYRHKNIDNYKMMSKPASSVQINGSDSHDNSGTDILAESDCFPKGPSKSNPKHVRRIWSGEL